MKSSNRKIYIAVAMLLLSAPMVALAGGLVPCGGNTYDPAGNVTGKQPDCNICFLGKLIINVTNYLIFYIAIPLAVLMIVAGGMMLLISGGSEGRVRMGKTFITNAIIGLFIVFLAWIMIDTVIKVLTGGGIDVVAKFNGFLPWNELPTDPAASCPL